MVTPAVNVDPLPDARVVFPVEVNVVAATAPEKPPVGVNVPFTVVFPLSVILEPLMIVVPVPFPKVAATPPLEARTVVPVMVVVKPLIVVVPVVFPRVAATPRLLASVVVLDEVKVVAATGPVTPIVALKVPVTVVFPFREIVDPVMVVELLTFPSAAVPDPTPESVASSVLPVEERVLAFTGPALIVPAVVMPVTPSVPPIVALFVTPSEFNVVAPAVNVPEIVVGPLTATDAPLMVVTPVPLPKVAAAPAFVAIPTDTPLMVVVVPAAPSVTAVAAEPIVALPVVFKMLSVVVPETVKSTNDTPPPTCNAPSVRSTPAETRYKFVSPAHIKRAVPKVGAAPAILNGNSTMLLKPSNRTGVYKSRKAWPDESELMY